MNSTEVGTEHLLLGLIRDQDGVAVQVLLKLGISLEQVRQEVEAAVPHAVEAPGTPEPKLTHRARRVLQEAADEARRMRHNYIGAEHLLLAVGRQEAGLAADVLRRLGFSLEAAREHVTRLGAELDAASDEPSVRQFPDLHSPESGTSDAFSGQWQRFTERARRVVLLAQEEASKMHSASVGLDHMLVGLVREKEGIGAQV